MHRAEDSGLVGAGTSTPHLAVVRRGERGVFRTLLAHAEATGAEVIWDRRREERRATPRAARPERRRGERRAATAGTWGTLGFVFAPRRTDALASAAGVAVSTARPQGDSESEPSAAPRARGVILLPPWQVSLRLGVVAAVAALLLIATSWVTARSRSAVGDPSTARGDGGTDGIAGYLKEVQAQIRERWAPAGTAGQAGDRVVVRFALGRDGQIQDARVEESSGSPGRDHAGLSAVVAASPFPPLPPDLRRHALSLQATFPPR